MAGEGVPGVPVSEEAKKPMGPFRFTGTLESADHQISQNTQKEFCVVKFLEMDETLSTFSSTQMAKLDGSEGKKFDVVYRKSADGKYNNILNVEMVIVVDVAAIAADAMKSLEEVKKEVAALGIRFDSLTNTIDKVGKSLNAALQKA